MHKYILTAVAGMALLASCKKYISYDPHDTYKVTALDYLKTESDYRTMEVSVYTPLQWLDQVVPIGDIASDNAVSGGESASDVLDLQQIDDFTLTPVNGTLTQIWQYAYEGVNRANYLFQYRDKNPAGQQVSFAGKDAMYGEVYFLRAYYYFTLAKMFGDVPLFVDKRLDISNSGTLKRVARSAVYLQAEADLNSAIAVLPAVQVQKGRITKYAAQALAWEGIFVSEQIRFCGDGVAERCQLRCLFAGERFLIDLFVGRREWSGVGLRDTVFQCFPLL
ncbi:RagB/SusD family nutrient uptake outer membrane protein [Puia sp. P3]|uniref:RagB/SusD family nutrient uptake outer membrane protein n=1 Tax=Puia sp. P3 TaxID=3423952 RepID=UPI003D672FFE